tara:strand:- start:3535 stop:4020 length:486 start_codon:yes stop_codon:yes gene_type:complete
VIRSREQLFNAIRAAHLPENLLRIWEDDVPSRLQYTLQNPASFFEAFLSHPEGFPSPDELLILWQTNGQSIVGYLPSSRIFILNYLEDGPDEIEVLGESYQQMLSGLIAKLIMREVPDAELLKCVEFLGFKYLFQLQEFIAKNPNWEENTASLIAEIESTE